MVQNCCKKNCVAVFAAPVDVDQNCKNVVVFVVHDGRLRERCRFPLLFPE